MPYNGSGGFTVINTFVPGSTILSSAVNQNYSDIATAGLSNCLTKDGQQVWGANQKAGGFGITGMVAASAAGGAVEYAQWQVSATPIGGMMDFGGTSAPAKWLLCGGQAVSRTTYSLLFAAISSTWGNGDGVTTFNVPDFRGRATYGTDNMGGTAANRITVAGGNFDGTVIANTGGLQNHTMTSGELVAHNHTGTVSITDPGHGHSLNLGNVGGSGGAQLSANNAGSSTAQVVSNPTGITATTTINNTGSGNPFTILGPAIICNKIIFAGV